MSTQKKPVRNIEALRHSTTTPTVDPLYSFDRPCSRTTLVGTSKKKGGWGGGEEEALVRQSIFLECEARSEVSVHLKPEQRN